MHLKLLGCGCPLTNTLPVSPDLFLRPARISRSLWKFAEIIVVKNTILCACARGMQRNLRCFSTPRWPHNSIHSLWKQTTARKEIIKIIIICKILFPSSPHGVEDYLPPPEQSKGAADFVDYVVEGDAARSRSVGVGARIVTSHFLRSWLHGNYRRIILGVKVDWFLVRRDRHVWTRTRESSTRLWTNPGMHNIYTWSHDHCTYVHVIRVSW